MPDYDRTLKIHPCIKLWGGYPVLMSQDFGPEFYNLAWDLIEDVGCVLVIF